MDEGFEPASLLIVTFRLDSSNTDFRYSGDVFSNILWFFYNLGQCSNFKLQNSNNKVQNSMNSSRSGMDERQ